MNEDESREVAVFTEAVKVSHDQRAAFLDEACAGDGDLRRKVEALLSAHNRLGNFLEEPPPGGPSNGRY
jgi:eukaryotic-like serine/threonine-protein kinase